MLNLEAAVVAEKELNSKISKVKKEINPLNTKIRTVCIKARNEYTQRHLKLDFKNGQRELIVELEAAGSSITLPEIQSKQQALNFEY